MDASSDASGDLSQALLSSKSFPTVRNAVIVFIIGGFFIGISILQLIGVVLARSRAKRVFRILFRRCCASCKGCEDLEPSIARLRWMRFGIFLLAFFIMALTVLVAAGAGFTLSGFFSMLRELRAVEQATSEAHARAEGERAPTVFHEYFLGVVRGFTGAMAAAFEGRAWRIQTHPLVATFIGTLTGFYAFLLGALFVAALFAAATAFAGAFHDRAAPDAEAGPAPAKARPGKRPAEAHRELRDLRSAGGAPAGGLEKERASEAGLEPAGSTAQLRRLVRRARSSGKWIYVTLAFVLVLQPFCWAMFMVHSSAALMIGVACEAPAHIERLAPASLVARLVTECERDGFWTPLRAAVNASGRAAASPLLGQPALESMEAALAGYAGPDFLTAWLELDGDFGSELRALARIARDEHEGLAQFRARTVPFLSGLPGWFATVARYADDLVRWGLDALAALQSSLDDAIREQDAFCPAPPAAAGPPAPLVAWRALEANVTAAVAFGASLNLTRLVRTVFCRRPVGGALELFPNGHVDAVWRFRLDEASQLVRSAIALVDQLRSPVRTAVLAPDKATAAALQTPCGCLAYAAWLPPCDLAPSPNCTAGAANAFGWLADAGRSALGAGLLSGLAPDTGLAQHVAAAFSALPAGLLSRRALRGAGPAPSPAPALAAFARALPTTLGELAFDLSAAATALGAASENAAADAGRVLGGGGAVVPDLSPLLDPKAAPTPGPSAAPSGGAGYGAAPAGCAEQLARAECAAARAGLERAAGALDAGLQALLSARNALAQARQLLAVLALFEARNASSLARYGALAVGDRGALSCPALSRPLYGALLSRHLCRSFRGGLVLLSGTFLALALLLLVAGALLPSAAPALRRRHAALLVAVDEAAPYLVEPAGPSPPPPSRRPRKPPEGFFAPSAAERERVRGYERARTEEPPSPATPEGRPGRGSRSSSASSGRSGPASSGSPARRLSGVLVDLSSIAEAGGPPPPTPAGAGPAGAAPSRPRGPRRSSRTPSPAASDGEFVDI